MKTNELLTRHLQDLPYFRAIIRAVEATFYQNIDLPRPILDVGCGDGHFTSVAFTQKIDVGVDPWHGPIHEAFKLDCHRLLIEADGAGCPIKDGFFSSAISNSVLEHIPHVDAVLKETARVLKGGAFFYFSVPNERYLSELSISKILGHRYTEWFRRISRVQHADPAETWQTRLEQAGFRLDRYWHYFSPAAMRVLEWGHYLGLPSWFAHKIFGRWILVTANWNLWLTEKLTRRYASPEPTDDGTFTFYVAQKV